MRFFLFLFLLNVFASEPLQNLSKFLSKKDYENALLYWNKILEKKADLCALFKVSELEMLLSGREASQKVLLDYLKKFGSSLSEHEKKEIIRKLSELLETFFSEDGQALYFQAVEKIKNNDCASALNLLERAMAFEKGNLKILTKKIQCEKVEKNLKNLYYSLEMAYRMNPYLTETLEELIEVSLYFGDYKKALNYLDTSAKNSIRMKTALAYSLFKTGDEDKAFLIVNELMKEIKTVIPPILYFIKGKLLISKNKSDEALKLLENFVSLAEKSSPTSFFDPYRLDEKVLDVKKMINEKKT